MTTPSDIYTDHYFPLEADVVRSIAREASRTLGRRATRSRYRLDLQACEAVHAAAVRHGLTERLWEWAEPGATITELAGYFVYRYLQSYGAHSVSGLPR